MLVKCHLFLQTAGDGNDCHTCSYCVMITRVCLRHHHQRSCPWTITLRARYLWSTIDRRRPTTYINYYILPISITIYYLYQLLYTTNIIYYILPISTTIYYYILLISSTIYYLYQLLYQLLYTTYINYYILPISTTIYYLYQLLYTTYIIITARIYETCHF